MRITLLAFAVLATLSLFAAPAEAQFSQDPGQQCLCPDDPFCTCTGGEGGSSGDDPYPGACQTCGEELIPIGQGLYLVRSKCIVATEIGTYRRECYIQPDSTCYLSGNACSIVLA